MSIGESVKESNSLVGSMVCKLKPFFFYAINFY